MQTLGTSGRMKKSKLSNVLVIRPILEQNFLQVSVEMGSWWDKRGTVVFRCGGATPRTFE